MNARALGGAMKLGIAAGIAWAWANGYLATAMGDTIKAFSTPRALKVPTIPAAELTPVLKAGVP